MSVFQYDDKALAYTALQEKEPEFKKPEPTNLDYATVTLSNRISF